MRRTALPMGLDERNPLECLSAHAAAREAGARAELLVPGGWRIIPGTALPALKARLKELAASWPVTGRMARH